MSGKDLIKLYSALVRSILEYSSVTYGPMLSKSQSNQLERVQKQCLRIMFGYGRSYSDLLSVSGLDTLRDRRTRALAKFADRLVKNPIYSDLFPRVTGIRVSQRNNRKYLERFARTQRL